MAVRFQSANEQFFDSNGDPLSAGSLTFTDTGTSTPHNTFSDDALTTPNTNPVVLDSAGRAGNIFLDNADYKVILKNAAGTTIWTADPVHGGPSNPLFSAISVKSGNYSVLSGDTGKLFPVTATATITLPAATVGTGFRIGVVNAGAGIVTVSRAGADTLGTGLTSVKLPPNVGAFFQADGTSKWYVVGLDGRGKGADIASAGTLPLGEDGDYFHVTGTTTITGIEARPTGFEVTLEFDGALTLTHNAASFILPTGANITTAAGDVAIFRSESDGGNYRLVNFYTTTTKKPLIATLDPLADFVPVYDTSANVEGKMAPRDLGGATLFKNGTNVTINNTVTETTIFQSAITIPANSMGAHGGIRITIVAQFQNNSGGTETVTLRVKLGGVTIYQDATAAIATSAILRPARLNLSLNNRGLTNSQWLNGLVDIGNIVAATTGEGDLATDTFLHTLFEGTAVSDSTTALAFDITIQHSVANANITWTTTWAVIEYI